MRTCSRAHRLARAAVRVTDPDCNRKITSRVCGDLLFADVAIQRTVWTGSSNRICVVATGDSVNSEIAATNSHRRELGEAAERGALPLPGGFARHGKWPSHPPVSRRRMLGVGLAGALGSAGVAYATAQNPAAPPGDLAIVFRVVMIVALISGGLYAHMTRSQARMGALLSGVGLLTCLWLLNGSSNRLLFSIGVLMSGVMPAVFGYLILAHPTGKVSSRAEQQFLWRTGGLLAAVWLLGVATTRQPPLKTPLLVCGPHCPDNVFSLGSTADAPVELRVVIVLAWLALTCGTPLVLYRRMRTASMPLRLSLSPLLITASALAVVLTTTLAVHAVGLAAWTTTGALYVSLGAVVPLAIFGGLVSERLFMGDALAGFVNQLVTMPAADPQALMAAALCDPSLRIAYRRPEAGTYVDSSGIAVDEAAEHTATAWIERGRRPVAAVLYDEDLAGYEPFIRAAGAAALTRLEKTQLEADLKASMADLASSRVRLMETAHAERRRLERDLHDRVQQHLVGLRIKLAMAGDTLKEDPARGERALALVGDQMDELLQELRSLARGIYPSLLHECGLPEALRAAARSSPMAVAVRSAGIDRLSEEVELAVYYCCLEALQNTAKHAGSDATALVTLTRDERHVRFEVHDSGVGFDSERLEAGNGLVNMRDRVEAVGGALEVVGRQGRGTSVRGTVPIA